MLTRIKKMYHQEALTLLRWLAYARSPPTLGELIDAAITDPVEESFIDTSERGGLRDALNILAGLVTIEENQGSNAENFSTAGIVTNGTPAAGDSQGANTSNNQYLTTDTRIKLAHFSVKEYLESERILRSKADRFHLESAIGHQTLAKSCITYLRYYSISPEKTLTEKDLETFPLLKYAAQSWFYHCALQYGRETSREVSFLQIEQAKDDWLLVHDPDTPWSNAFLTFRTKGKVSGSALYYASLLGLSVVVSSLLASGADVNAEGGYYCSAIQAAAGGGYVETVQLLVDKGADVNAQGGECSSAVQAAAAGGHIETVKLLVDKGADVNAESGYCGSALQAAAVGGHIETVKLLVDKGADVNAQGGTYGSAVQAAIAGVHTETVQLLVDLGADVNAQDGNYSSPVYAAAGGGNVEIVKLLVDKGADVNALDRDSTSAVYAAAGGGHVEIVKLLVDKGADVNAQGGYYNSAVQAAAARGHIETVKLLVDKGADVNAESGYCGSALQAASREGHAETVKLFY
jgi:ankyrin repeat protein